MSIAALFLLCIAVDLAFCVFIALAVVSFRGFEYHAPHQPCVKQALDAVSAARGKHA